QGSDQVVGPPHPEGLVVIPEDAPRDRHIRGVLAHIDLPVPQPHELTVIHPHPIRGIDPDPIVVVVIEIPVPVTRHERIPERQIPNHHIRNLQQPQPTPDNLRSPPHPEHTRIRRHIQHLPHRQLHRALHQHHPPPLPQPRLRHLRPPRPGCGRQCSRPPARPPRAPPPTPCPPRPPPPPSGSSSVAPEAHPAAPGDHTGPPAVSPPADTFINRNSSSARRRGTSDPHPGS